MSRRGSSDTSCSFRRHPTALVRAAEILEKVGVSDLDRG
jgi:hypothetical protein